MTGIRLFDPKKYVVILFFFLFLFPKGGFKAAGIPITWGYIFLGFITCAAIFGKRHFQVHKERFQALLLLLPFQVIAAATMVLQGISNLGMTVAFWISFFFVPYAFLFVFSREIDEIDSEWFFRSFKRGMLFIAIYGIVLFLYRWKTQQFFEIPFLTTNFGDYGLLNEKCNTRGFFAKLISTYNNGNLYGACLIMALPLYCYLEKRYYFRWVVKLSFLLTLSRTVWFGLLVNELIYLFVFSKDKGSAILRMAGSFVSIIILLALLAAAAEFPLSFFFDSTLGGRDSLLEFSNADFFSSHSFGGIVEVVYAGVIHSFGWFGLATFLLAMCVPLILRIASTHLSPIHWAIALGLINYLIISVSDGAILYLPTMAFYWFFLSLLHRESLQEPAALGTH